VATASSSEFRQGYVVSRRPRYPLPYRRPLCTPTPPISPTGVTTTTTYQHTRLSFNRTLRSAEDTGRHADQSQGKPFPAFPFFSFLDSSSITPENIQSMAKLRIWLPTSSLNSYWLLLRYSLLPSKRRKNFERYPDVNRKGGTCGISTSPQMDSCIYAKFADRFRPYRLNWTSNLMTR
jgi:hypothetical protein